MLCTQTETCYVHKHIDDKQTLQHYNCTIVTDSEIRN